MLLVAGSGCRQVKDDQTVCPEYRDVRCVGDVRCTLDKDRGCKVCRCEALNADTVSEPQPDDASRDPSQPPP
jgi:hypothetical protein